MKCRNHASVAAAATCTSCGKSFCSDCLVPIRGQNYCATCKKKQVPASPPPPSGPRKIVGQARTALLLAVFGMFCAYILEPMALAKAAEARKLLDADPALDGHGMVVAAQIIAVLELAVWALSTLAWWLARSPT